MSITAQQLLDVLRIAPEGLTSKQVSAKLGITSYEASSRLSKLAAEHQEVPIITKGALPIE